jgi:hypothetical protein
MVRAIRYRPSLVHGTRTRILQGIGLERAGVHALALLDPGFSASRALADRANPGVNARKGALAGPEGWEMGGAGAIEVKRAE